MTINPANWDADVGSPLTIYQGATNSQTWTLKDSDDVLINLTGYTARMMFRDRYDSESAFITLTTENSGISLGGSAGTITWTISATASAALTNLTGYWDLELINGSTVNRIVQGKMVLSLEATK